MYINLIKSGDGVVSRETIRHAVSILAKLNIIPILWVGYRNWFYRAVTTCFERTVISAKFHTFLQHLLHPT